jgi:hypothetical protein
MMKSLSGMANVFSRFGLQSASINSTSLSVGVNALRALVLSPADEFQLLRRRRGRRRVRARRRVRLGGGRRFIGYNLEVVNDDGHLNSSFPAASALRR